jgi:hypothetical protein
VKHFLNFSLLFCFSVDLLAEDFDSYFCSELLQTAQSIENLHCSFETNSEMATICGNSDRQLVCRVTDDDLGVSIVVGMEIADATAEDDLELDPKMLEMLERLPKSEADQDDVSGEDETKFDVVASLHCHQNRYSEGSCSITQRKSMLVMVSDEQARINDQLYTELSTRATKLYQSK